MTTTLDQMVFRIAGIFILVSVALAHWHHPNWLWFTAFVGLNMFQTSFTGFCPMAMVLRKLGVKPGVLFCKNAV